MRDLDTIKDFRAVIKLESLQITPLPKYEPSLCSQSSELGCLEWREFLYL